mmetsp:Transcript_18678/g.27572  ORF Transcript_18678/g.27572 Transcript_18678/m.27572 type:complete len:315 (+) Transcript_18678:3-947(+)
MKRHRQEEYFKRELSQHNDVDYHTRDFAKEALYSDYKSKPSRSSHSSYNDSKDFKDSNRTKNRDQKKSSSSIRDSKEGGGHESNHHRDDHGRKDGKRHERKSSKNSPKRNSEHSSRNETKSEHHSAKQEKNHKSDHAKQGSNEGKSSSAARTPPQKQENVEKSSDRLKNNAEPSASSENIVEELNKAPANESASSNVTTHSPAAAVDGQKNDNKCDLPSSPSNNEKLGKNGNVESCSNDEPDASSKEAVVVILDQNTSNESSKAAAQVSETLHSGVTCDSKGEKENKSPRFEDLREENNEVATSEGCNADIQVN